MSLENAYYIAGIVTAFTSFLGLVGLVIYAVDTRMLRVSSQEQTEAMIRPCVVFVEDPKDQSGITENKLLIRNVGIGAAMNIRWRTTRVPDAKWIEVAALAAHEDRKSALSKTTLVFGISVECQFEGMGGIQYTTLSYFSKDTDLDIRHTFMKSKQRGCFTQLLRLIANQRTANR